MARLLLLIRLTRFAFLEFFRDGLAAFFSIVFPLMFAIFFGLVAQYQSAPRFKVSVHDLDRSEGSRQLISYLGLLPGYTLVESTQPAPDGMAHLTILRGAFQSGGPAIAVTGPASAVYLTLPLEAARSRLSTAPAPFSFEVRTEAAPAAAPNPFRFMLPGLMALAIITIGIMGTASPLHRARSSSALRHLATTSLHPSLFLGAHGLVKLAVCVVQVGLLLAVGIALFDIPMPTRPLTLLGITLLGGVMLVGIGFALAAVVPRGGAQAILLVNFALTFLGHIFWDVSGVPVLADMVNLMPTSYLADALRQLTLEVPGLHPMQVNVLVMLLVSAAALAATSRWFRFVVRH
jgi:ABC-2 type transport system permease protein